MASNNESTSEKAGRHRSPNYPAVGLDEAVKRVRMLVEKDGKAGAPTEVAAKHIGFSGAHGTARAVISALRKFGLTSEQRGRIVPTPLAIDILNFAPDHPRSRTAKVSAVLSPNVYKQLFERYADSGNLPSAAAIRPELIADLGFNPKAVDAFLTDFVGSLVYAGLIDQRGVIIHSGDDSGGAASTSPTSVWQTVVHSTPQQSPMPAALAGSPAMSLAESTMRELTLPLMDNLVAYLRVPSPLSDENYDYLLQQINILRKGLVAKPTHTMDANLAGREITPDMRRRLLAAGLSPSEISDMSQQDAWIAISHHEGIAHEAQE